MSLWTQEKRFVFLIPVSERNYIICSFWFLFIFYVPPCLGCCTCFILLLLIIIIFFPLRSVLYSLSSSPPTTFELYSLSVALKYNMFDWLVQKFCLDMTFCMHTLDIGRYYCIKIFDTFERKWTKRKKKYGKRKRREQMIQQEHRIMNVEFLYKRVLFFPRNTTLGLHLAIGHLPLEKCFTFRVTVLVCRLSLITFCKV